MFPLEYYITKQHRIDLIKSGQGHLLNKIQAAIFRHYGIDMLGFN
jgi:hypothetical protein